MKKSLQQQNRKQNQRRSRRQYNSYGGTPSLAGLKGMFKSEPQVVCPDGQFLHKKTCVTQCPEGTHGDTDCSPHECVSGTRDGFFNAKRAAACRTAKAVRTAYLRKKYQICKNFVTEYEAAMPANGAPPSDAALAKLETADTKLEAANDNLEQTASVDSANSSN
jgi:hypothetical protein